MKKLSYSRKTSIVLHNEDYTNAGLKQEDMMDAIKQIDGVWMVTKYCINSNIEVHIKGHSKEYIIDVLDDIKFVLDEMLYKNR